MHVCSTIEAWALGLACYIRGLSSRRTAYGISILYGIKAVIKGRGFELRF